jgi:hypothetical protein
MVRILGFLVGRIHFLPASDGGDETSQADALQMLPCCRLLETSCVIEDHE